MAKRGRKPKNERKGYFYEVQEEAVKKYLETDDLEKKNEIFNTILKPAFTKMIESIIRRYKLYVPEEEFEDTFNDTLSFLSSKMSNFNPEKHHKAYSYYGTICKNYLIYKINQFRKKIERNEPYDDVYEKFQNNINFSQEDVDGKSVAEELVDKIVVKIRGMIDDESLSLSENEKKVGTALCELFKNWEDILCPEGSNKLRKSSVLYFLREETMMSTKELRENMAVYKKEYYLLKNLMIE
jgi:hypothetical protein